MLHHGIPFSFEEHSLLTIDLVRKVPEARKPRRIEIGAGAETKVVKQENQPKQIDISAKKVA